MAQATGPASRGRLTCLAHQIMLQERTRSMLSLYAARRKAESALELINIRPGSLLTTSLRAHACACLLDM